MKTYYILKQADGNTQLIETIQASNLTEARKMACATHLDVVLSLESKLIVVGKSGYTQFYQ